MGVFDFLQGALPGGTRAKPALRAKTELFDDEFQRKLETLAIVSRRVFAGRNRAERRTKKQGSGIEFADHRNYTAGDDFRFVDWGAYQRFGRLLVRLFEEEEDLSIYFLVDCSRSMGFGDGAKFDQARRLCAALAYVALANLDRVTILGIGDKIQARMPPARGKQQVFKVFRFLNGLTPTGSTDLREAIKTFVAQHKRRGLAVLISDLYDPLGFELGINMLRHNKFEPYVLHVTDPRETVPSVKGDVSLYDCETGDEREVTLTDELIARVQGAVQAYQGEINEFCRKSQLPYFAADTQTAFDALVLSVFRQGGFLR